jgi:hypothetical protein
MNSPKQSALSSACAGWISFQRSQAKSTPLPPPRSTAEVRCVLMALSVYGCSRGDRQRAFLAPACASGHMAIGLRGQRCSGRTLARSLRYLHLQRFSNVYPAKEFQGVGPYPQVIARTVFQGAGLGAANTLPRTARRAHDDERERSVRSCLAARQDRAHDTRGRSLPRPEAPCPPRAGLGRLGAHAEVPGLLSERRPQSVPLILKRLAGAPVHGATSSKPLKKRPSGEQDPLGGPS